MPRPHSFARYSDPEYIRAIRAGGPDAQPAIAALYRKYRRKTLTDLSNLLRRQPGYNGLAEDLMHDAFIVMLQKIETGAVSDVRNLAGLWIHIAKHRFLNERKKEMRIETLKEPESRYGKTDTDPEQLFLSHEESERMESIFRQLGSRCRDVLLLWASRYTMDEIAFHLNLSGEGMARKIKYACFKKLKEWVNTGHNWPS